jgi:hypothetical protein
LNTISGEEDAEIPRVEVALLAPDLIEVIRNLDGTRVTPAVVPPAPTKPPKAEEEKKDRDRKTIPKETEAGTPEIQPSKVLRDRPLLFVSRAGNRETREKIGYIQTVGSNKEQCYNLGIDAPLQRDLVLEIADRVGVQRLKAELKKRNIYDDPLRLSLYLGGIKLSAPVLRDPETEEIEFSIDFIPFLAGLDVPALSIQDRKRPFIVSIGEAPSSTGGASA